MITRIWFVLLGAIAIMTFALLVLVVVPGALLSQIEAPEQLQPYEGSIAIGRDVYIREGCVYCHSQQVRDPAFTTDVDRGWGRPSVPSDYVYDSPHLIGTMRTGPDLMNVGARLPDRQWHLLHLYQPRAINEWSVMPSFPYLFEELEAGVETTGEVVRIPDPWAPERTVVASADATALVDYLISLNHSWPIPEGERDE